MQAVEALPTGLLALAGLVSGDFADLVVQRSGAHASLRGPWWSCPVCGAPGRWAGRLPVVGALRRPACRSCGVRAPTRIRPLVLGLVLGAAWSVLAATVGLHAQLPADIVLAAVLVVAAAVDLERLIIPTTVVYAGLTVVGAALVAASAVDGRWAALGGAVAAGAVAFAVFFAVHAAVPHGMGFGDVRLAALVGLGTGWTTPASAFAAFLAAFVLGAVGGVVLMAVTGQGRRAKVPFGPFLAAGAFVALVGGGSLAHLVWPHG